MTDSVNSEPASATEEIFIRDNDPLLEVRMAVAEGVLHVATLGEAARATLAERFKKQVPCAPYGDK